MIHRAIWWLVRSGFGEAPTTAMVEARASTRVRVTSSGASAEVGMTQKPTDAQIENEANNGLKNDKYTVAMARTNAPHSATAQFFINASNNGFLNHTAPSIQGWGYAVFGKVTKGQDVVNAIRQGDKITSIEVLDSTDALFASQQANLDKWNKVLG